MLKITDKLQSKEILVTKGAYENLYKSLGYTIVGEKKEAPVEKIEAPEKPIVEEKAEPKKEVVPEKKDDDEELMNSILNKKYNRKKN